MTQYENPGVNDAEEKADPDQTDIGEAIDTDGDGIPDDLEVDDLDDLVAAVDPDSDEVVIDDPEEDEN